MNTILLRGAALGVLLASISPAVAQDVIMRRPIPATGETASAGTPSTGASTPAPGPTTPAPGNPIAPTPAPTVTGFAWNVGTWSVTSDQTEGSSCGYRQRSRTVTCREQIEGSSEQGQAVPDEQCQGEKPAQSENGLVGEGCTFEWQFTDWQGYQNDATCGPVQQNRGVTCLAHRSQGGDINVAPQYCDQSIPHESNRTFEQPECGRWSYTDYADPTGPSCGEEVWTRTATCVAGPGEGTPVEDAQCSGQTQQPLAQAFNDESGCGYEWRHGEYQPDPTPSCGTEYEERRVWCVDRDGNEVPNGKCDPNLMPNTYQAVEDTSGCEASYGWNIVDEPVVACGHVFHPQKVYCADTSSYDANGHPVEVDEANCDGQQKPEKDPEMYRYWEETNGCQRGVVQQGAHDGYTCLDGDPRPAFNQGYYTTDQQAVDACQQNGGACLSIDDRSGFYQKYSCTGTSPDITLYKNGPNNPGRAIVF